MAGNPHDIQPEEALARGIWTQHSEMANGELRFRLKHSDGTAYIRTEATNSSGWQKSHYHRTVRETYIVQRGRMALAELIDGALKMRVFGPSEICTTEPNISHNVYLYRDSVIHTVKHGEDGSIADWHVDPSLDKMTSHLTESEIGLLSQN
ncbi:hypothetical protein [Bradyrhizobium sp.]|uniref:hypothetical protein n=1 Tax=Bradyrhizobium sp. TaxID=376 RepID=UPI003C74050B